MAKTSLNLRETEDDVLFVTAHHWDNSVYIGTNSTPLSELPVPENADGRQTPETLWLSPSEAIRLRDFLVKMLPDD